MIYGSKPVDDGNLILDAEERNAMLSECPDAKRFIRPFLGSVDLINGIERWCIWLANVNPSDWRHLRPIRDRVEAVRSFRLKSKKAKTVEQADEAFLFGELRQPSTDYLAVPEVSSERRRYIPIAFVSGKVIASNLLYTVPDASLLTFAILTSPKYIMATTSLESGSRE